MALRSAWLLMGTKLAISKLSTKSFTGYSLFAFRFVFGPLVSGKDNLKSRGPRERVRATLAPLLVQEGARGAAGGFGAEH